MSFSVKPSAHPVCSTSLAKKELVAQTGHQVAEWPLVVVKELIDNALDACEETGVAPVISVTLNEAGIEVTDNGPALRIPSRVCWITPSVYRAAKLMSVRHAAPKGTRSRPSWG